MYIKRNQEHNAEWFAQHCKPAKVYQVGDYVVVRNVDTVVVSNKKFIQTYRGRYIISKVLPNDRYVVKDIEGCQLTQIMYDGIIEARHLNLWRTAVDH